MRTVESRHLDSDREEVNEQAATRAKGRALAALGYGHQFAPDLDEGERIVDAPREQRFSRQSSATHSPQATKGSEMTWRPVPGQKQRQVQATEDGEPSANEQQLGSIRKLCAALGREKPARLARCTSVAYSDTDHQGSAGGWYNQGASFCRKGEHHA